MRGLACSPARLVDSPRKGTRRYTLASSLSTSLDSTATSLTTLIQTLNALSPSLRPAPAADAPEDPLTQIAAILNAHLGSLRWIEGTAESLKKGVADLEGRVAHQALAMGQSVREPRSGTNTPARLGVSAFGRSRG